jgi:hypothetical protein
LVPCDGDLDDVEFVGAVEQREVSGLSKKITLLNVEPLMTLAYSHMGSDREPEARSVPFEACLGGQLPTAEGCSTVPLTAEEEAVARLELRKQKRTQRLPPFIAGRDPREVEDSAQERRGTT